MQGLIIDTSCNRSFIILAQFGKTLAFLPMEGGEKLSKSLGRTLQELLDQHPSFRANFIAIGTGPGSYTGIRVGTAMAKALAYGWETPLLPFCSLQSFIPSQTGPFAVLIDARMGGCYCLKGTRSSNDIHFEQPFLLKSSQELSKNELLVSPHPADIQKRLGIDQFILDGHPDPSFLSSDCCQKAPFSAQNPLAPLPLVYFH
jgi:tRNA threonylcarbamoyl adenosine modification protein YeaZ